MVFPHLSELASKYKDRGLRTISINIEEDSNSLDQFVQSQGAKMDYNRACPLPASSDFIWRHVRTL